MIDGRTRRRRGVRLLVVIAGALVAAGRPHAARDLPSPIELGSSWLLQDAALVPETADDVSSVTFRPEVYAPKPYEPTGVASANPPDDPGANGAARPQHSSAWQQAPGLTSSAWYRAIVPGTVLTTLVANGVYPEPLYGENNRPNVIPESLARARYWYRTVVAVPRSFADRRVWLTFDGINYLADVWVNGRQVGEIRGAFVRGRFDVTPFVVAGQPAAVAVLVTPPQTPSDPLEQTEQWGLGLNGGIMSHDGPTFVAAQGWDWMPAIRDRDAGIWQRVTLSASGPIVLRDPHVRTHVVLPSRDEADVTLDVDVENVADAAVAGSVAVTFGPVSFRSSAVTLGPLERRTLHFEPTNVPALRIAHPKLWWPNGFGDPNLYPVQIEAEASGTPSDVVAFNVGLRDVAYAQPGSPNLTLIVNGVPVFAKGGDWGMDEALKRMPRARLDAAMRLHRDAHYTIVRNWVGQSTSEDFYDLADRYGLMVWDEFFQPAAGLDSGRTRGDDGEHDVSDVAMYLENARDKVLRFRHHPSIVIWCGRNEGEPSPRLLADDLRDMMAELDPDRLYQSNSDAGRGVRSGGPYAWQPPEDYYGEGRGGRQPLVPFKTEIGAMAIPTLDSILAMMPAADAAAFPNDDWAEHDFATGGGNNSAGSYLATLRARYGDVSTLPRFVRAAALADYEAARALYEGRFAALFHPATAVITWMSHPAQPSLTWQMYAYDLEPFASYFAVKLACEPLHVELNQRTLHVMVVNHRPEPAAGLRARLRIVDLDGTVRADRMLTLTDATASSATDEGAVAWPQPLSDVHVIQLDLLDATGRVLSTNVYWRNGAATDDLTALDSMPMVPLDVELARHDEGATVRVTATLRNTTSHVALMAHVQLRRARDQQRVLPAWYSDNYVSILPGETRPITIEAAAADLSGDRALVTLDGWNVTTTPRAFGGAVVAPNTAAIVERPTMAGGS